MGADWGGEAHYLRADGARLLSFVSVPPTNPKAKRLAVVDPFFAHASADESVVRAVLAMPHAVLDCDVLLLRGPCVRRLASFGETLPELQDRLRERTGRGQLVASVERGDDGVLQSIAADDMLDGDRASALVMVRECRRVEVYGSLLLSGAVHRTEGAHYQLPSGTHANEFIRVADMLDSTTAVSRLADWLAPDITAHTILLTDTATILSLLFKVSQRSSRLASPPPSALWHRRNCCPILTLPNYPTVQDFRRLCDEVRVLSAGDPLASVLVVISVVSSGDLLENLHAIARRELEGIDLRIRAIVNTEPQEYDVDAFAQIEGVERYPVQRGWECKLCLDPRRRAIIAIDSRRYTERVEPELIPRMLTAASARVAREFWEAVDATDAVSLHVNDPILNRHLEIWLDVGRVLRHESWRLRAEAQLRRTLHACDVALVPENQSTTAIEDLLRSVYGKDLEIVHCSRRDEIDRERLRNVLRKAHRILIMDDVLIRGTTIRSLHRLLQDFILSLEDIDRPSANYEIAAFVVVARPPSMSVWEGLQDSLRQGSPVTLNCAQLVPLPSGHCSWCEESNVLRQAIRYAETLGNAAAAVKALSARYQHITAHSVGDAECLRRGIFFCDRNGAMGQQTEERVTSHSVFGEKLSEAAAYAAVASAMQRLRDEVGREASIRRGASWFWNVPRIVSAYHDPLLQASFLRCARGQELFVPPGRGLRATLAETMSTHATTELTQWSLLAAEHLVALAVGTYPRERWFDLIATCLPVISERGGDASDAVPAILAAVAATEMAGRSASALSSDQNFSGPTAE